MQVARPLLGDRRCLSRGRRLSAQLYLKQTLCPEKPEPESSVAFKSFSLSATHDGRKSRIRPLSRENRDICILRRLIPGCDLIEFSFRACVRWTAAANCDKRSTSLRRYTSVARVVLNLRELVRASDQPTVPDENRGRYLSTSSRARRSIARLRSTRKIRDVRHRWLRALRPCVTS